MNITLFKKNENSALQIKTSKLMEKILSEASVDSETIIKKYDKHFHTFLARNIDRSKMDLMIYGVGINGRR